MISTPGLLLLDAQCDRKRDNHHRPLCSYAKTAPKKGAAKKAARRVKQGGVKQSGQEPLADPENWMNIELPENP